MTAVPPRSSQAGAGTVLVLGLLGVGVVLAVWLAALAGAAGARGQAQTAADLAALAGATVEMHSGEDPCGTAEAVAGRNGGRLTLCQDEGAGVLRVEVERDSHLGTAVGRSRAGPLSAAHDRCCLP